MAVLVKLIIYGIFCYTDLVHDEQDTIRALLVDNCIALGKILSEQERIEHGRI